MLKKKFGPKKCWAQKCCGSKKNLVTKTWRLSLTVKAHVTFPFPLDYHSKTGHWPGVNISVGTGNWNLYMFISMISGKGWHQFLKILGILVKMLHEGLVWKISPLWGASYWRSYSYNDKSLGCRGGADGGHLPCLTIFLLDTKDEQLVLLCGKIKLTLRSLLFRTTPRTTPADPVH